MLAETSVHADGCEGGKGKEEKLDRWIISCCCSDETCREASYQG